MPVFGHVVLNLNEEGKLMKNKSESVENQDEPTKILAVDLTKVLRDTIKSLHENGGFEACANSLFIMRTYFTLYRARLSKKRV